MQKLLEESAHQSGGYAEQLRTMLRPMSWRSTIWLPRELIDLHCELQFIVPPPEPQPEPVASFDDNIREGEVEDSFEGVREYTGGDEGDDEDDDEDYEA